MPLLRMRQPEERAYLEMAFVKTILIGNDNIRNNGG
jgi:hypothetical protein